MQHQPVLLKYFSGFQSGIYGNAPAETFPCYDHKQALAIALSQVPCISSPVLDVHKLARTLKPKVLTFLTRMHELNFNQFLVFF